MSGSCICDSSCIGQQMQASRVNFFSLNNFALLAFFAFGMSWQNINISPMPALLTLGGESRCINVSFLGFTILHLLLLLQFQFVVSLKQIIVI